MPKKTPDGQFDMTEFGQVLKHAEHLKQQHTKRNTMFDAMRDLYMLLWDDEDRVRRLIQDVKLTKDPSPRNDILGAIRLMVATDPIFSVPFDKNDTEAQQVSEGIERMAGAMWNAAGRVRGDPIHYDSVLSMLLFAELHLAVTKTADLVRHAEGASPAAQKRAEELAMRTPYLFDNWDPRTGYPELDSYGLNAFYREITTTTGKVLDEFGDDALAALKGQRDRYTTVTLCHFWDFENRYTWLRGFRRPIVQEAHGLPRIPIVCQLGEGTRLFDEPEYQRQPFLYTLWKSGLWDRKNLILTVLATTVFAIGSNGLFVYKRNDPDKHLSIDHNVPGGVVEIDTDEDLGPLSKQVIDPGMMALLELADNKGQESTIYKQALGAGLGANAPYSMVALLNQAGRLPLVVPQRKSNWGIADAVKLALDWLKADGEKGTARYGGETYELKPADIPDYYELEATLDINLPQDQLQQANLARLLTEGDNPLVSQAWVQEHILKIEQPKEMRKQIWRERAGNLLYVQFLQDQINQANQQPTPPLPAENGARRPGMSPTPGGEPAPQLMGMPNEQAMGGMQGPQPVNPNGQPPTEGEL